MGEIFTIPEEDATDFITLIGFRFMGKKLAIDTGLILIPNLDIPLPWIDFSYHW
jgi:hypothetical protein